MRSEKSCFECWAPLDDVSNGECPHCGHPFDSEDATTHYPEHMRWYHLLDVHVAVIEMIVFMLVFLLPTVGAFAALILIPQGSILMRYGDLRRRNTPLKETRMHLVVNECLVAFFVIAFAAAQYAIQTYIDVPTSTP